MTATKRKKKTPFLLKVLISFLLIGIIGGTAAAFLLYKTIYHPNVFLADRQTMHIYIPTGSTYQDVKNILYENGMIMNTNSFEWVAEKKNYRNNIRPGRYLITEEMGNNELINLLRSGNQDHVNLTFNNIRTPYQLAGSVSRFIEADSLSIIQLLRDEEYLKQFDLNPEIAMALFIPNTYQVFWNTSADQIIRRMHREYNTFWNDGRLQKAQSINLNPFQVSILASIVQQETAKKDEVPKIAGVYINRLKRGMLLQACPTVIYAVGDFSIRRVLNHHLEVDSPYNTYKNKGLPPGLIALPEPHAIDAVLNYERHDYLFFSAKEDFSGYHHFAKTYRQHRTHAARYHNALQQRRIMR